MFATPVCVHFHPVAQEANAELRPLILEKAPNLGGNNHGEGWRSPADFESWGGDQAQTLFNAAAASRRRPSAMRWLPVAMHSISVAVANNAKVVLPIP